MGSRGSMRGETRSVGRVSFKLVVVLSWLALVGSFLGGDALGQVPGWPWTGDIKITEEGPGTPGAVNLGVSESKVLRATRPIVFVTSTDRGICEVQKAGENAVAITGIKAGAATVIIRLQQGPHNEADKPDPFFAYRVTVAGGPTAPSQAGCDYLAIAKEIARLFPGSKVTLTPHPTSRNLIVAGKVKNSKQAEAIVRFVQGFGCEKDNIINMLVHQASAQGFCNSLW